MSNKFYLYTIDCKNREQLYFETYKSTIVPLPGELVELEFNLWKSDNLTIFKYFLVNKVNKNIIEVIDPIWEGVK